MASGNVGLIAPNLLITKDFEDVTIDGAEEIVIASKQGRSATFARLSDRPDAAEILAEGSLGDIWYSGILGGVPEE